MTSKTRPLAAGPAAPWLLVNAVWYLVLLVVCFIAGQLIAESWRPVGENVLLGLICMTWVGWVFVLVMVGPLALLRLARNAEPLKFRLVAVGLLALPGVLAIGMGQPLEFVAANLLLGLTVVQPVRRK